ncbi:PilN domain-containing protein [Pectinatus sottacetonis]|uniref:PilN domain-containing protein n=1 Tax=Pectinatus sottacetonis TaxID=1002795 RepID=UPI0018C85552|nr:PilN domain-containing protein [Pectinatus sottacetonis]
MNIINKFAFLFVERKSKTIALTITDSGIYLAIVTNSKNIWYIKNIEHHTIDGLNSGNVLPLEKLKAFILKNGCQNYPIIINISDKFLSAWQNEFPPMTNNELKKAVYWEIKGSSPLDNAALYAFSVEHFPQTFIVTIYAITKTYISTICQLCSQAGLKLYGVFPIQPYQYIYQGTNTFMLKNNNDHAVFKFPLTAAEIPPDYLLQTAQTILAKSDTNNLLPDTLKPPFYNWHRLSLLFLTIMLILTITIMLTCRLKTIATNKNISEQTIQLHNMETLSRQKDKTILYSQDIARRQAILIKLNPHTFSCYSIMGSLGFVCPSSVYLTSIKYERNTVFISGRANDSNSLNKYISAVKDHSLPHISLSSVIKKETAYPLEFTLKLVQ